MQNYKIFTDTASDLPEGISESFGITEVPLKVFISGKEEKPDVAAFYRRLRDGEIATTSAPNLEDFIERMEPALRDGFDILFLAFSSALSSTFQTALLAKTELEQRFPDRKIRVIDTRAASTGEGLLVYL
ncbi:MAG: DegV family protein, partial [Clostridia bacterium]|nr:DegV family protein [Clostridia bacterium]